MAKHVELVGSECKHKHYVINYIEEKQLMQKACRECGAVLEENWQYDECRVHYNYSFKQVTVVS